MRNLIILLFICLGTEALAQQNSPYSRFGLGQPYSTNTATSKAMGNISTAFRDSVQTNLSNPASLSNKLFSTIDFGVNVNFRSQQDPSATSSIVEGGVAYIGYSFPVMRSKKEIDENIIQETVWGMGFGVVPLTYKGYDITSDVIDGRYINEFEGQGNTYKLYWQNGVQVTENLSLGVDTGILFGRLEDNTFNTFLLSTAESLGQIRQQKLRGLVVNLGGQYQTDLSNDFTLTIGTTYRLESDLDNEVSTETQVFNVTSSEVNENGKIDVLERNILSSEETVDMFTVTYPHQLGFGAYVNKKEKWSLGIDAKMGFWDEFQGVNDDSAQGYRNSIDLGVGGSFIPNYRNPKKSYEGFEYRYGGFYNQTFLTVANQDINEYGISLGVGLPVRRNIPGARIRQIPSNVDVGITFGQQGSLDNDLIQDSFIKGTFGLSLNDVWFQKKKYD